MKIILSHICTGHAPRKVAEMMIVVFLMIGGADASVPEISTLPAGVLTTVNNGLGGQTDPHIGGNITSYTSRFAIK